MSNVSTVTPVEASEPVTPRAIETALGCVAAARWLLLETDEEKAWLDDLDALDRASTATESVPAIARRRLADPPVRVQTLHLRHRHVRSLVRSAEALGFAPTSALPVDAAALDRTPIRLARADGERLVISRTGRGRVALLSPTSSATAQLVIQQHVTDRAERFLRERGFRVHRSTTASGEHRIRAVGASPSTPAGSARVDAMIGAGGAAQIDIDRCQGTACEPLASALAEAMGARIESQEGHDSFLLPGEPARTRVRG